NVPASGGTGSVNILAAIGVNWSATSNDPWIMVTPGSGSGNGVVAFSVSPNTGMARTGTIAITANIFTVNQAAGAAGNARAKKGDFDGDGRTDLSVWRGSTSDWMIMQSLNSAIQTTPWGAGFSPYNDLIVPGDYDGDGKTDLAVWRPLDGNWYII